MITQNRRTKISIRISLLGAVGFLLGSIHVFAADVYVANYYSGTVGEYDATTGAPVNTAFITGLSGPLGLALSGNDLFIVNRDNNTIGEYDATTGAVINSAIVTGLNGPQDVKALGGNLYVSNFSGNTINGWNRLAISFRAV